MFYTDEYWMNLALLLAKYSKEKGEIPVGSIIIKENNILGIGWNSCISLNDPSAHAEIIAIKNCGNNIKNYRFNNSDIFITHEPCVMCSSAIVHARIKKVVFGSFSNKNDCFLNFLYFLKEKNVHTHIKEINTGVLLSECENLLKSFFKDKRKF